LNGQPTVANYNGLQLRFSPVEKLFYSPRGMRCGKCFENLDPNNPQLEKINEQLIKFAVVRPFED